MHTCGGGGSFPLGPGHLGRVWLCPSAGASLQVTGDFLRAGPHSLPYHPARDPQACWLGLPPAPSGQPRAAVVTAGPPPRPRATRDTPSDPAPNPLCGPRTEAGLSRGRWPWRLRGGRVCKGGRGSQGGIAWPPRWGLCGAPRPTWLGCPALAPPGLALRVWCVPQSLLLSGMLLPSAWHCHLDENHRSAWRPPWQRCQGRSCSPSPCAEGLTPVWWCQEAGLVGGSGSDEVACGAL